MHLDKWGYGSFPELLLIHAIAGANLTPPREPTVPAATPRLTSMWPSDKLRVTDHTLLYRCCHVYKAGLDTYYYARLVGEAIKINIYHSDLCVWADPCSLNPPVPTSRRRNMESSLDLNNIVVIQSINLNNRPWRVFILIVTPQLNLHLVAHGPVSVHVGCVDDEADARIEVRAHHVDEGSHVLVRLTDTGETNGREGVIRREDAAHAYFKGTKGVISTDGLKNALEGIMATHQQHIGYLRPGTLSSMVLSAGKSRRDCKWRRPSLT